MDSFEENRSSGPPGGVGNGIELFLDTQGACFMCLKEPSSVDETKNGEKEDGLLKDVSLREICRFLEISGLKRGRSRGKIGGVGGGSSQYDFAVALCDKCSTYTNRLSELVRKLEEIQSLAAFYLQKIQGILRGSQEGDQFEKQWEKIREFNPVEVRLVEYLREETTNKCTGKLATLTAMMTSTQIAPPNQLNNVVSPASSNSTVLIDHVNPSMQEVAPTHDASRVPIESVSPSATPTTLPSSSAPAIIVPVSTTPPTATPANVKTCPASPVITPSSSSTDEPNSSPHQSYPIPTDQPSALQESSKQEQIFSQNYSRSLVRNGVKQFHCLYCNFMAYQDASEIRKHLLTSHPSTLFTKIPRLSEPLFKNCVAEFLASETKKSIKFKTKTSKQSSSKISESFDCTPCNRNYRQEIDYKYHLVMEHYSSLEKKLKSLQKSHRNEMEGRHQGPTSIEEQKDKEEEVVCAPIPILFSSPDQGASSGKSVQFNCKVLKGGCGKAFSKLESLRMHEKVCHKRKEDSGWECAQSDGGCGKWFASKGGRDRHQRQTCPVRSKNRTTTLPLRRSSRMSAVTGGGGVGVKGAAGQGGDLQKWTNMKGASAVISDLEERGLLKSELNSFGVEEDMEDDDDEFLGPAMTSSAAF